VVNENVENHKVLRSISSGGQRTRGISRVYSLVVNERIENHEV